MCCLGEGRGHECSQHMHTDRSGGMQPQYHIDSYTFPNVLYRCST